MEIHAPEGEVRSWKAFGIHIATVTVGILIALSLEGLLEWRHHRHLVELAEHNLRLEMMHTKEEVTRFLASVKDTEVDYQAVVDLVSKIRDNQGEPHGYRFRAYSMQLSDAAWSTAQASGAVAYMEYPEIQKYSDIYSTQAKLAILQDRFIEVALAATPDADPRAWSVARFDSWKQLVAAADIRVRAEEHVAVRLMEKLKTMGEEGQ